MTQLLAEGIQGQSQQKLEMSNPDNNNNRRHSLRTSLRGIITKLTESSMWGCALTNIRENYNLINIDKHIQYKKNNPKLERMVSPC